MKIKSTQYDRFFPTLTITMSEAEWACIRHYAHYYAQSELGKRTTAGAMKLGKYIDNVDELYASDRLFNFEE